MRNMFLIMYILQVIFKPVININMRVEWIDDILAVLDTGSLTAAAEVRFLTQSAFTRRIRMIEKSLGVTLFDRRRKPVTLLSNVEVLAPEMRELSSRLKKLNISLIDAALGAKNILKIACQHSITTSISPEFVSRVTQDSDLSVRIHSGDRDECLMMLIMGKVDFTIVYQVSDSQNFQISEAIESISLQSDILVPVCSTLMSYVLGEKEIITINYPDHAFLGKVYNQFILPKLPKITKFKSKAETSLTLAAYEYAMNGIGVAWLPLSLVALAIKEGKLRRLDSFLPSQVMDVKLLRRVGVQSLQNNINWGRIIDCIGKN